MAVHKRGRLGPAAPAASTPRFGLARVLSKAGLCSRSEAARWIQAGRVRVRGKVILDPEHPVSNGMRDVQVAGLQAPEQSVQRRYLMLNKPRGLVTTASDEKGRETVYRCLDGAGLPWLAPVGRLDKASEGLLLFCNDPQWAARVLSPEHGPDKTYHVQIGALPGPELVEALEAGVQVEGEFLRARQARLLRGGQRNAWLEIVLDEGRNRHIRRLLAALDVPVLRLVRVAIGGLVLGELGKGQWRELGPDEVAALAGPAGA